MTKEEVKSCIGTIEMLQRLAYNIHGVMDVIDADNCKKIIKALEQEPKTGHWIFDDECKEHGHCPHCGYGRVDLVDGEPHNFCRNCGAKMQEVEA